jgi:hypothetical protein
LNSELLSEASVNGMKMGKFYVFFPIYAVGIELDIISRY